MGLLSRAWSSVITNFASIFRFHMTLINNEAVLVTLAEDSKEWQQNYE